MSVAVLIADAGGAGAPARIAQSRDLWRRLGLAVDLVLVSSPGRSALPPVAVESFRRFGCIPGDVATRDAPALLRFLARLNDGEPHAAAHVILSEIAPVRAAAPVWIAELPAATPVGGADLFLAGSESERTALSAAGCRAVRLPVEPLQSGPWSRGRAVGWIGDWSAERVALWTSALQRLSRHGTDLSGGIVLIGPGAVDVAIPDNLAQWACAAPGSGHLSVLGLAAAPGPALGSDQAVLAQALTLGVPVLLGRAAADVHEDRWHLPVADHADALADRIAAWSAGTLDLSGAIKATRRAFARDLVAMTDHVLDEIAALVPSASRRRGTRPRGPRPSRLPPIR